MCHFVAFLWRGSRLATMIQATIAFVAILFGLGGTGHTDEKALIQYGWGSREPEYLRRHWREMETYPFDGVGIIVPIDRDAWRRGETSTENQLSWRVMAPRTFRVEAFQPAIDDLRAVPWTRFRHNFLPVALSNYDAARGLNWFDDDRWRVVVNNFAVVAKIAADGRLRGLILDPEHYGYSLFSYRSQRRAMNKPFRDYAQMARTRGREIATAVRAHLPNATILALYGYTLPLSEMRRGVSLEDAWYGLIPAFYDGVLEALPDGATFVDGFEFSYGFKERAQFVHGYHQVREEAASLSAVPALYRQKVRVGFGLMLDYEDNPAYFSVSELRNAVAHALEISDGYVWLYSQRSQFFPLRLVTPDQVAAIASARAQGRR